MKPYEWMVRYTPQKAWIESKGLMIWLSMYFGMFGGGVYLVSLYFNHLTGMFISWLIVLVIKGGLHMAHAQKPLKLWRMVLRPQTSWISRGFILTILFIVFGAAQLAFSYWAPGTAGELIFKVLGGVAAFGVMIYAGFALSCVSGIPFWNVAILPILFILWGILSGVSLVSIAGLDAGSEKTAMVAGIILLVATLVVIGLYLWTETYAGPTARESVRELTRGSLSILWGIGVILIGIMIPLVVSLMSYFNGTLFNPSLTILIFSCEMIGGLTFTYGLLRAGVYGPLITTRV
jgi:formate-dependent nitrite reductase membrane component NrfD